MLDQIGHTTAIEAPGQQNTTEYRRCHRVSPGQSRLAIEAVGRWDHQATGRRCTTLYHESLGFGFANAAACSSMLQHAPATKIYKAHFQVLVIGIWSQANTNTLLNVLSLGMS